MKRTPLSMIAHWAAGELHGEDVAIDAIGNDSRKQQAGNLYVALRGERFDGHDFAADAAGNGAAALLVDRLLVDIALPQVVVADTEKALARIAHGFQQGRGAKVVGITGSNGKTSVKTLAIAIFQRAGETCFNPGNRNNEIGLPLAVIDAPDDAQYAIYEMGAGKPGDIAWLTDIARPDVAVVNNVAAAHLERLGSLLGVAETKGAIYAALPPDGVAVINADDAFAEYFASLVPGRKVIRFGLEYSTEVSARDIRLHEDGSDFVLVTPQGEAAVTLGLPGRHNVANALAAASLALGCDIPLATIVDGLAAARPVSGRQAAYRLANGSVLVDDSYNANPGSLDAAIDTLAALPGQRWLVLGDMRELGPEAAALHADAGARAKRVGVQRLYALGELSGHAAQAFGEGARVFDAHAGLAAALAADLQDCPARVLVKGSRGSAMDRVVTALLDADNNKNDKGNTPHVA